MYVDMYAQIHTCHLHCALACILCIHKYRRELWLSIEVSEFNSAFFEYRYFRNLMAISNLSGLLLGKLVVSSMAGCTLGTPARRAAAQVPAPA